MQKKILNKYIVVTIVMFCFSMQSTLSAQEETPLQYQMKYSFDLAIGAIKNNKQSRAIRILSELIKQHPGHTELYINLAAAYAANGQLNKARDSLLTGLNQDSNSTVLFTNLQAVHGVLAANAYKKALLDDSEPVLSMNLPIAKELKFSQLDQQLLTEMKSTIQSQSEQLASLRNQVADLQAQVDVRESQVSGDQDLTNTENTINIKQNSDAIALVKGWAVAWSNQNVDAYVSHYSNNYAPEISHALWLEQREIRLTNKAFIKVDVSDFVVAGTERHFSVTFIQRYRSDDLDDTIRKQLTFKANSSDWQQAKIVDEKVIQ